MRNRIKALPVIVSLAAALVITTPAYIYAANPVATVETTSGFKYAHDPRLDSKAMRDIVYDPTAIYGFVPRSESGTLTDYAVFDYSDPVVVEKARQERIKYIADIHAMIKVWDEMLAAGKNTEEIARAVSAKRNQIRLDAYENDPEGLALVKKRNLEKYGDESGPTAESLLEKYGSWETVLLKSFSSNSGMDACLGLYDAEYENNIRTGAAKITNTVVYVVEKGDNLSNIAKEYYGTDKAWVNIYEANKDSIKDYNVISVGQELIIPIDL